VYIKRASSKGNSALYVNALQIISTQTRQFKENLHEIYRLHFKNILRPLLLKHVQYKLFIYISRGGGIILYFTIIDHIITVIYNECPKIKQINSILINQRNKYTPKWFLNFILMSEFRHKKEYPALDPKLYTWPEVSLKIREDSQPKSSRNMI